MSEEEVERLLPEEDNLTDDQVRQCTSTSTLGNIQTNDNETETITGIAKYRTWKNLLALSASFMLIFTAYCTLQNLESSLNSSAGLGDASLATIYGSVMVACFVAPLIIRYISPKWVMLIGFVAQTGFAAVNFYSAFYTLIPMSIVLGLTSAVSWTGQGVYLTSLAEDYAATVNDKSSVIINRFNGIFFFFFQNCQIWGNLISSLVLDFDHSNVTENNATKCGTEFCGDFRYQNISTTNDNILSNKPLLILLSILLGCNIIGTLILCLFVDNRKYTVNENEDHSISTNLTAFFNAHTDVCVLLVVPLFLWTGMEEAFLYGEFTEAYISCELGIQYVGYAIICYGVTDAIAALLVGRIERWTGRIPLFVVAGFLNASVLVFLLFWNVGEGPAVLFYVIPAVWGISDAVWQTTTSAFIGVVFKETQDAVFAVFHFWNSCGFVICFAYSHSLCIVPKVYIAIGTVGFSVVCYLIAECALRKTGRIHVNDDGETSSSVGEHDGQEVQIST